MRDDQAASATAGHERRNSNSRPVGQIDPRCNLVGVRRPRRLGLTGIASSAGLDDWNRTKVLADDATHGITDGSPQCIVLSPRRRTRRVRTVGQGATRVDAVHGFTTSVGAETVVRRGG
ncbi:MAG: hypothetical protein R2710_27915 [Acidimicrobiales bacterium]